MKGIAGKILRLNLTRRECAAYRLPDEIRLKWLGGRGAGNRLLMDETPARVDPLSPEANLYFMLSPLVGTLTPGISKTALIFKSPLTGGVFVSLCGGSLGATLKFAGWDGIVIEGKSDKPSIIIIDNDRVTIEDAGSLWGMEVSRVEAMIRSRFKDDGAQAIITGPAGEKMVKFASLHSGRGREFGRGGAGAIFGAKNLKGVVVRGNGGVAVADPGRLEKLTREAYQRIREDEKARVRRRWGTLELVATINELGFWPTRNFSEGYFEGGNRIDAIAVERTVLAGHRSCYSCPVSCGKIIRYTAPDGRVFELEGPEFESLSLLGPNLGIGNIESIAEASRLCDELGLDTISMGSALGLLFEAHEAGRLPAELASHPDLGFGKPQTVFDLIRMAAMREGELGRLLGEGVRAFAHAIKCEDLAMHVKGLGLPAYDPRGIKGLGLNYATAASGANHMRGPTMGSEIDKNTRLTEENKAKVVIEAQVNIAIADSTCLCSTVRGGIDVPQLAEFLEAVTGEPFPGDVLNRIGREIITLERRINLREGFTDEDDTLPRRMIEEPFTKGGSKGTVVNLEKMKREYYHEMGWDEHGVPPGGGA